MTNTLQFTTAHPSYANNIVHDVLRFHYRHPSAILKAADYAPHMQQDNSNDQYRMRTVGVGKTDWTREELTAEVKQALREPYYWQSKGMVCSYTGYTAKQMLAAMLNDVLAEETDAEYVRRVDAILNDAWIYPKTVRYYDDVYAQHQANRHMC